MLVPKLVSLFDSLKELAHLFVNQTTLVALYVFGHLFRDYADTRCAGSFQAALTYISKVDGDYVLSI